jgi:dTDP-4-amino-4,6-dideoxygalactose transaminase
VYASSRLGASVGANVKLAPKLISPTQLEYLPFALPDIGEEEIAEVVAALRSGWVTSGPRVAQFEREFLEYTGAAHALAVNSCTAGLHLALTALGIGPGDEVITTPLTFCATVNAILETGADAVLADVGEDLNLDPGAIARAITPRTKAILPVHLAGLPCDMNAIWRLASEHGLRVVEDAAHAVGGCYAGRRIGAGESDAVAFSFYATKNLTTGEGGMVTTDSEALDERMRIACLHGISRDAWNRYAEKGTWYYEVVDRGFKYNMPDIAAAIGIHQLRKLDRMNERRAEIARSYNAAFQDVPELEVAPEHAGSCNAWHLYILRMNLDALDIDRGRFFEEMRARRIGCSVHFIPIPLHPYYRKVLEMRDPCSRALAEYPRLLSLPLYSSMTDDDVRRVIEAVRGIVLGHSVRKQFAIRAGDALHP